MRLKIDKMEHFHYRKIGQIGHFFMNFHYARYKKVKKNVPPNIKNEASDHLKRMGITEILRKIWLFSANKIKSSESFSK